MPPRIAVIGAGLIGQVHIGHVAREARLSAVVDPSDSAADLAAHHAVPHRRSIAETIAADRPDGAIIATPTPLHVTNAMACIEAGIPVLVEKPIGDTLPEAEAMVQAAERAGVAVLVGHHRRYNPIIRKAKALIDGGALGRLVSVNALCWLYKPDDYFAPDWRRAPGAGPVLTNLIHDIDLLRHLCGEIDRVQTQYSSATRGFEIEDTAVSTLAFANGALGTLTVSDSAVAPWSWELTAAENKAYPATGQACYMISGTRGALEIPTLRVWSQGDSPSWWAPIDARREDVAAEDPLALQIRHFCDVIAGRAAPLVTGREGVRTLGVIHAMQRAARHGASIQVGAAPEA